MWYCLPVSNLEINDLTDREGVLFAAVTFSSGASSDVCFSASSFILLFLQFIWIATFLLSFLSSFFSVSFSEEVVFTISRRKKEEGKKKNSQCFVFGKFSNLVYCMISSPHLPSPAPLLEVQFIHAFVKIFLKKGVFKLKAYGWYLCGMAIQRRLYWNPLTHANWFLGAFHNAPR